MKIHLDTDIGGDIDDLCALAMLLRWPGGLELSGITTVAEAGGRRAGYVSYVLGLEGRGEIPIAAGAEVADGFYRYAELGYPTEEGFWPEPVPARPSEPGEAVELIRRSVEAGAMLIGIGPFTNLRLADQKYPGLLQEARLVLMGGYVWPVREGFPDWGNDMDWNLQVDVHSAKYVLEHSNPLLVPLSVTVETALRRACLAELRGAGRLGQVIATQAEFFAAAWANEEKIGKVCAGLPDDLINFQHDPLASAIALGWDEGLEVEEVPLKFEIEDGWIHERIDPAGKLTRVVRKVDGERFSRFWVERVCGMG